ncbi:hypothetical protein DFJ67_6246 [Asanoa ferruginea]|uniref:Uncharacterized protein n=1 Tax=Asanoa ferruginea TaxID=53367 RepID=A0A3D9ZUB5_9ACTN|nr:hypothetical protein DFJ67_6246 [Asanoa ferruginea]
MSFQPLPDRAADASYPAVLAELLDLVGAEHPQPAGDTPRDRRSWQHAARRSIGKAVAGATARNEWFAPLARAAPGTRTPTAASQAELDQYADLDRRYGETALRVFVATENIDVRRCILLGLDLRPHGSRPELHDLVAEATRIARESTDDYLRHRVEIQVAE